MAAGQTLGGRFELETLAGAGAMGEVYRARDAETGRRVAVKVMPGRDGDAAARFVREARILAELTHPYIVGYLDHGATSTGNPWLAMEWLEGEDLVTRLQRGPLGMAESMKVAEVIAEALAFVHARGIVHRDLKPSNVFLVQGDVHQARLLDFGIARIEAAERMTRRGMLLGTPGYMAPEQVHGGLTIDARGDVFSLGCVLFECLTGEPLFRGATILAILAKVVLEPAPRLKDWLPDAPEELDELLWRMLGKEPGGRPENGAAVAAALRALGNLTGDPGRRLSPRPDRSRPSLTGSEQRAVAVILIGSGLAFDEPRGDAPTMKPETLDPACEANLRAEAALHGGRLVRLLNGAVAVELTGAGLATDLASQAARCALSLRGYLGGRPIALALGKGDSTGDLARGPAIDRSAKLLAARKPEPGAADTGLPVLLDEVQAGLLDARFDVRQTDEGLILLGEHVLGDGTRTLLGRATPCVGRERELGILEQLFESCVEESAAQAVLVTAHPGVGKSRLAQEFLRQVRDRRGEVTTWIGRGDSLRAGSAFGLLGQLLRGACDVREGEALEVRRDKVRVGVAELVPEPERPRVAEFLGEILGAPFPDENSLPLRAARRDASLMNEQMRAAFLQFAAAACERSPVLILLEDLHWGDHPTVQFLDKALSLLRGRPLFVLALARPEVSHLFPHLWIERGAHELRLKELGQRPIERLVRHVLGDDTPPTTIDRLARLSDGNAFYLEELIRWAAERREGDLPETLVTMVQSRLGALDDESRRALRVGSVFGEAFWSGAVAALLGDREDPAALEGRLRELCERELLIRRSGSRFPGHDEYAFRHALLREGAYAMLTDEDRSLGHRLAGDWLEARGERDALLLAEHLEKGGEGERAGSQYLTAARRASAGSDTVRALICVERGLALPLSRDLRLRLLGLRCELHMYRIELAVPGLPQAQALMTEAERGSVAWTQALLLSLIAAAQTGTRRELERALETALAADFQPDALEVATMLLGFGAAFGDHAGEVRKSDALVKRSEALVRPRADAEPAAALFHHLVVTTRTAFADEDPWSGLEHARKAHALAISMGHTRYILGSKMWILVNSCFLGRHAEAWSSVAEWDVPDGEFGISSSVRPFVLSWTFADMGSFDEAGAWAEHLIAAGQARGLPLDEARGRWVLGELRRRTGDLEKADAALTEALSTLAAVCPLDEPAALASLAALRLAQGRLEEALAAAEGGMARYRSIGACGMFRGGFLRLVHVEALKSLGRDSEARKEIAEARRHLLANAAKIPEPGFRASFLEQVAENRRTLELARAQGAS